MNRAVFLDRDGTINVEVDNLTNTDQLRLIPKVARAIQTIKAKGFLVIVVTNQPVVARGLISYAEMMHINTVLQNRLKKRGALVDKIYACPHHPNANLPEFRLDCPNRKPNAGYVLNAKLNYDLDLSRCYFIGDRTADIKLANDVGMKSILLKTGYAGTDRIYQIKPDWVADDLYTAVKYIH